MGNVEMHDLAPVRDDERKELDLSRKKINFRQYNKHVKGEYSENCLRELPWSIRDAVSLYERMDVSFNALTTIPVEIPLRLPHLSYCNLSHNLLTTLPESFALLFHMKTLILSNNKISSLPKSFTHLVKLEKLDLSHNVLTELPADLGTMESLSKLNVTDNKLKQLPMTLGASETLSLVLAFNNRLLNPPQSVCNEGSEATITYLRNLNNNGSPPSPKICELTFPRVRGGQMQSSVFLPESAMSQYIEIQAKSSNSPSCVKLPLLPPLGSTTLSMDQLRDRVIGLLYGAAVGDAIGIATANMNPDECRFYYDSDSIQYKDIIRDEYRVHWKPGAWTSYFDEMCLVLESVIHWGGVVDELDFAQRLKSWSQHGLQDLDYDTEGYCVSDTTAKVLQSDEFLRDPHAVAWRLLETRPKGQTRQYSDNGPITRALILGIPHFHDLYEVTCNVVRICKATHADPQCVTGVVFLSLIVALSLQGDTDMQNEESVEGTIEKAKQLAQQHLDREDHVKVFEKAVSTKHINEIGVHAEGLENHIFTAVAAAMYAFRNTQKNFSKTVLEVTMLGGSAACHGCLMGALLGCYHGYKQLPQDWVPCLRPKHHEWLASRINHLLDMMGIP